MASLKTKDNINDINARDKQKVLWTNLGTEKKVSKIHCN